MTEKSYHPGNTFFIHKPPSSSHASLHECVFMLMSPKGRKRFKTYNQIAEVAKPYKEEYSEKSKGEHS